MMHNWEDFQSHFLGCRINRFLCPGNAKNCELFLLLMFGFAIVNPQQPEVFGVKFILREIGRTFSIEIGNLKLGKMPKLPSISGFHRGDIF